jgi:hypothetical protein
MNAIPPCPSCHDQFDCTFDPGFIFIPTDLQYFIEFELKDREHRKREAERGVILKREVPTSEMYKLHQVNKGIITADAIGGQYLPVFLKQYLLNGALPFDLAPYLSKPREWHGAPLACLRRYIHILGGAHLRSLERQTRLELEKLRNLYFFDEEDNSPPPCNELLNSATQTHPNDEKKKRQVNDIMPNNPQSPKKQRGTRQGKDRNSYNQGATTRCPILQRTVPAYWSLGPDVSTEEAVCRFAPIIARSLCLIQPCEWQTLVNPKQVPIL